MAVVFLIGRIIVGLFYLMMAFNHFTQGEMMSGYAASKNVPSPKLAVLGSGVLLLIGSLYILTGYQPLIGVIALVVFFVPVSVMMHNFWTVEDQRTRMAKLTKFMKNIALMGSALMFLAIPLPWPLGLG